MYNSCKQQFVVMESKVCKIHQRQTVVYDLTSHELICERCALFQSEYMHHSFIESAKLPQYCQQMFQTLSSKFNSLKISKLNHKMTYNSINQLAESKLKEEFVRINSMYDNIVKQIEKERSQKIKQIEQEVKVLVDQTISSLDMFSGEPYLKLSKKYQDMQLLMEQKNYQAAVQHFIKNQFDCIIDQIEKDLEISFVELRHKLANVDQSQILTLSKKISAKEEILINNIEFEFPSMESLKDSRRSTKSNCRTEISFACFDGSKKSNDSKIKSLNTSFISSSQSKQSSIHTLKVNSKSEIKSLLIKNNIKQVNCSQLDMNNRQAFEAIKKCTFNNFVSKIDLSNNKITPQFIIQLKREKIQSKYLKTISIKGLKLDSKQLKKEGINVISMKEGEGKAIVGDISVQF